jgi:putative resolvase
MKLSEWAAQQGVHYQTAWRWWKHGTLPVPARQLASGTILVEVPAWSAGTAGGTVVYARVSAHDRRSELERQVSRVMAWTRRQQLAIDQVVTEVGSGVEGRRPKLGRLLADPQVTTIVVERGDRLGCFGVEQVQAALSAHGRRVLVADAGEATDELIGDLVEVLTSLCARLYGRRGARNRAMRALTAARRSG